MSPPADPPPLPVLPSHRKAVALFLSALLCAAMGGCGAATTSQQLVGKWKGRPDSAEAKRRRALTFSEAQKGAPNDAPAEGPATEAASTGRGEAPSGPSHESATAEAPTDLEAFDFEVTLEFHADGGVDMAIDGGAPIEGHWRVLSTEVGLSIIEIIAQRPTSDTVSEVRAPEKRRFELEMAPDYSGFTLREEGADRRFGWLFFTRVQ